MRYYINKRRIKRKFYPISRSALVYVVPFVSTLTYMGFGCSEDICNHPFETCLTCENCIK